ncbi:FAD/NAD(P)-binding domain-containing protein [Xylariaceae sp. AK1471]|nr:FAD/NAD(P)-binding domain-containing protein [Xylariaceae sp. AK1471]
MKLNLAISTMADKPVLDVLIIGGGFAGLAAANTLARQLHTVAVFDSESYRNARSKHMHVMPAWDHKDPEEFRAAARKDLERYNTVQFHRVEILKLAKTEYSVFEATDDTGTHWFGRKVILASGVQENFPDVLGYEECWARGIYHCLFCHGYEQRGSPSAGVLAIDWIASTKMAKHMAHMAATLAKIVTIYTNGDEQLASELTTALKDADQYQVDHRAISRLSFNPDSGELITISFQDGSDDKKEAFLAHSPTTRVKGPFAEQLGLELTPMGDYVVSPPFSATTVEGVFAAGDCTSMFKVATNALASGSMTGAGVSAQLQEEHMGTKPVF